MQSKVENPRGLISLIVILAMLATLAAVVSGAKSAVATPGTDDYPHSGQAWCTTNYYNGSYHTPPVGLTPPPNSNCTSAPTDTVAAGGASSGFYKRECTSFVAWRMINDNGFTGFKNLMTRTVNGVSVSRSLSDAGNWGGAAEDLGYAVNMTPAPGAVAWWDTPTVKHVAWVRSVSGTDVTIEEYNWGYTHNYTTPNRVIAANSVSGYIHFQDIVSPPPPSVPTAMTVGTFYLRNTNTTGVADVSFNYGAAGHMPLVGDWNGDGTVTMGVYEPSTRRFFLRNSLSGGGNDYTITWGNSGWLPVVGDWDGNGSTTVGLFDPVAGKFYLSNSNTAVSADIVFSYGGSGHVPIAGDWDGNGSVTIGVYEGSTRRFFLRNSLSGGGNDYTITWGNPGWRPVVGDWNGDGSTTIGLFDPTSANWYLSNSNTSVNADINLLYGSSSDAPIAGDWDGDGIETIGVGH